MVLGRPHLRRCLRRLRAFVVAHRRTVAVDVVVLTAWAFLLFVLVVIARPPRSVLYVGILAGAMSYSLVARWREAGWAG